MQIGCFIALDAGAEEAGFRTAPGAPSYTRLDCGRSARAPYLPQHAADRGVREVSTGSGIQARGVEVEISRAEDPRVRNEALFRAVNQKLRELNVVFEGFAGETAVFVCECSRLDCIQQIELPLRVFDGVAARPECFLLVPGHEAPDLDAVVEREDGYVIVEKTGRAE
jgi:hypothetical protein